MLESEMLKSELALNTFLLFTRLSTSRDNIIVFRQDPKTLSLISAKA